MVYTSVGLFASSLSKNQIVSFIVGALLCFLLFYGFELISSLITNGAVAYRMSSFGLNSHYQSISRGVIDSRDVLFFIVVSLVFVLLTRFRLQRIS